MANSSRLLSYESLIQALQINDGNYDKGAVRQLEDLIIEASNCDVVSGKLDQKSDRLEVDFAMARDIRREDAAAVIKTLESWCAGCDAVLDCLERESAKADEAKIAENDRKAEMDKKVEEIRAQLKTTSAQMDAEDAAPDTSSFERKRKRE